MDGGPDTMKKTLFLGVLLLVIFGMTGTGCSFNLRNMPEKIDTYEESVIPTAGTLPASEVFMKKPRFGQFNIQKRHGLGAWTGDSSAAPEHELLQNLSRQP